MSALERDGRSLERLWLSHLQEAMDGFEAAKDYVLEVERQRSSRIFESPDGEFAYRQALQAETTALVNYSRILRIYSDLILRGKVPEEQE